METIIITESSFKTSRISAGLCTINMQTVRETKTRRASGAVLVEGADVSARVVAALQDHRLDAGEPVALVVRQRVAAVEEVSQSLAVQQLQQHRVRQLRWVAKKLMYLNFDILYLFLFYFSRF